MNPLLDLGTAAPPPPHPCMHRPEEQSPGRTMDVFFLNNIVPDGLNRISEVSTSSDFYRSARESRTKRVKNV